MTNGPLSPHLAQSTVQQSARQKVLWDKYERAMKKGLKGVGVGGLREMDWKKMGM